MLLPRENLHDLLGFVGNAFEVTYANQRLEIDLCDAPHSDIVQRQIADQSNNTLRSLKVPACHITLLPIQLKPKFRSSPGICKFHVYEVPVDAILQMPRRLLGSQRRLHWMIALTQMIDDRTHITPPDLRANYWKVA